MRYDFPFEREKLPDIMAHLSQQLQRRFLARLLSPEETLDVIKHLRECDACREELLVLRSNKRGSLSDTILPEIPDAEHPSADSLAAYLDDDLNRPPKVDLEEHLRTCEICQKALTDLKSFREELLEAPAREYAPVGIISGSTNSRSRHRWFGQEKPPSLFWFSQPFVLAGVAVAAALFLVLGIVIVRSPGTSGVASDEQIAVIDGDHRITIGPNGIKNPPAGLPRETLTALNEVAAPILRDEPPGLSDSLKKDLELLNQAPSTLLGPPADTVPFRVLSPVRTLIESARPTFKWTNAPGASGYTVHVVADDGTQEEVATSPAIPAPSKGVTMCTWSIPQSIALAAGRRYRWYVTALIDNQEIDAPGMEQPPAKFSVLSEEDIANLEKLKKQNPHDRLVEGLLNLNAGLLDDAQTDFQELLDDPKQTSAAKEFLSKMIGQIQRLKKS